MQIQHILFDCDNTLVLSEQVAFESCAELVNEVLAQHRVAKRYTGSELQHDFVGLTFRGQIARLQKRHGFHVTPAELDALVERDLGNLVANLERSCEPCEGAMEILDELQRDGRYGTAIVSSSAMGRVEASIKRAQMKPFFTENRVFSAASSLQPPSSKPDPAVYTFACAKLGANPQRSVAIEDSRSGAMAARSAGIPLMGYVGPYLSEGGKHKQDQMAKMLKEECGAVTVMYHWNEFWDRLGEVEAVIQSGDSRRLQQAC